jgi:tetratricopeptide (TPR) repeat protein
LSEYAAALSDFSKAIELEANFDDAWFNRSLVEIELKNYKAALSDPDTILALKPDHTKAHQKREELKKIMNDSW